MRHLKVRNNCQRFLLFLTITLVFTFSLKAENISPIKKILFIGDSMTGWMAERLNAYGKINGFEVATVTWDGSTISKWASSPRLAGIIASQQPDAIFVSLGMNELLERNPQARLSSHMANLKKTFGNIPVVWVGPPSWPGKPGGDALNSFLAKEMGPSSFFNSSTLTLPRQSAHNPHPSKAGICTWIDAVMNWIPENTTLNFQSLKKPGATDMSRGKIFIYKRMKESL